MIFLIRQQRPVLNKTSLPTNKQKYINKYNRVTVFAAEDDSTYTLDTWQTLEVKQCPDTERTLILNTTVCWLQARKSSSVYSDTINRHTVQRIMCNITRVSDCKVHACHKLAWCLMLLLIWLSVSSSHSFFTVMLRRPMKLIS